jgi:DNA polymerase-3 subunit alpha
MMVFSETLNASRELLEAGTAILLSVDVDRKSDSDELRFLAQSIEPLNAAIQSVTRQLCVHVEQAAAIAKIRSILEQTGQGRVKVHLIVDAGRGREATLEIPGGWNVKEETSKFLRSVSGVEDVREI